MPQAEIQTTVIPLRDAPVEIRDLEYIAFSGQVELAHGVFRRVPKHERVRYSNRYILSAVIAGGTRKMRQQLAVSAEDAANEEKLFLDEVVELFIRTSRSSSSFSRELFESLLMWGDELKKLSLLDESVRMYDEILTMEVNRFPDLYARCLLGKAGVLNTMGKLSETQSLLSSLAERPYIITDRNLVPELLFNLGKEMLQRGEVASYKNLLFRGLRHFYTSIENRRLFIEQIRKTYRHSYKVWLDEAVPLADKVLFTIHRFYFGMQRLRWLKYLGLFKAARLGVLGYVYCLNYVFGVPESNKTFISGSLKKHPLLRRRDILVTRAMGGIGDLLMMTPGLRALKQKHPQQNIHLAIPSRYFSLFKNNPDVILVDIENDKFNHYGYKKWFNMTDCPAARIESRTAPRVKKNRIELFARSLGSGSAGFRKMEKRPRYFVSEEEKHFQQHFWMEHVLRMKPVIGVQLRSDEVYRDYPYMRELVAQLSREYHVLVFDAGRIDGFDIPNVVKVAGMPMRNAFALLAACNGVVAPDSSFVHLAAAFDIPTVALYGPIDGRVRTMNYPHCVYLDARKKLGCMPCWRNDKIPCKLTGMRTSVCMTDISVEEITKTLNTVLSKEKT